MQSSVPNISDEDRLRLARRAFQGACWTLGLSTNPRTGEASTVRQARDLVAQDILTSIARRALAVPVLKKSALLAVLGNIQRSGRAA